MSLEPQTWIVGCSDEGGFSTRCLLTLEERFALPTSVMVCHGSRWRQDGPTPERVLAFVPDPPGVDHEFLGLLREAEAHVLLGAEAPRAATVAVGVASGRACPVDDAVKLAVTTLIDWGYPVTTRSGA